MKNTQLIMQNKRNIQLSNSPAVAILKPYTLPVQPKCHPDCSIGEGFMRPDACTDVCTGSELQIMLFSSKSTDSRSKLFPQN